MTQQIFMKCMCGGELVAFGIKFLGQPEAPRVEQHDALTANKARNGTDSEWRQIAEARQVALEAAAKRIAGLREELATSKASELRALAQLDAARRQIELLMGTVHSLRMIAQAAREISAPDRKAMVSSAEIALREENMALEARLRAAIERDGEQKQRIARLEALVRAHQTTQEDDGELSQAREQAAEYKRHIERLEAEAREKDEQIMHIGGRAGAAMQTIERLKAERSAPSVECPTCTPIIRAIADAIRPQIGPVPLVHRLSDTLPSEHAGPQVNNQTSPHAVRGIADAIRTVLAQARAPMLVREIAAASGIDAKRISTNIPHLVAKGDAIRMVVASQGAGWRYWSRARPLPDGVSA